MNRSAGAFEYLAKPFELRALLEAVERAQAAPPPAEPAGDVEQFGDLVGFSPRMVEVYKRIARAARSDEIVLITGESGVGKELVARAVHEHSARAAKPIVPFDCGSVAGTLWESELYGATRGAFTGADRDRPGVVETARGGSVFLDEIGEVPLEFQASLLRFLQEKEYRPVGASAPRKAEVRIIAATNRELEAMVRERRFREDLFYRLNVLRIDVPPLRQRREDIPVLIRRFLDRVGGSGERRTWLASDAHRYLETYEWPGNVRQLENLIRRLTALGPAGPVSAEAVQELLMTGAEPEEESGELGEMERRQILRVLAQTGGNKTRAAEILGIQRRTLYKKLQRIERERFGHTPVPGTQQ
ncbi:MAG: sigma-54-dependent Fis family transcriptional regulator [Acidobacteria bacterium]|nr:sigma-54-dependent Fis family transcriptional regulator [Acidobacteriota bacterium]